MQFLFGALKSYFTQTYAFSHYLLASMLLNPCVFVCVCVCVCVCFSPKHKHGFWWSLSFWFLFIQCQSMEPDWNYMMMLLMLLKLGFHWRMLYEQKPAEQEQNHFLHVFWSFSRWSHWLWGHWWWRDHSSIRPRWGSKGRCSDEASHSWL